MKNRKYRTLIIAISSVVLLPSCAQMTSYQPTVDAYGDPNAYRLNKRHAGMPTISLPRFGRNRKGDSYRGVDAEFGI